MLSAAILTAVQVYGIAIVVSLIIAIMIRVLVKLATPKKRAAPQPVAAKETVKPPVVPAPAKTGGTRSSAHAGTPEEVVAAISGALAVVIGPHRILGISRNDSSQAG